MPTPMTRVDSLVAEYRRERRHRRLFAHATRLGSAGFGILFCYYTMWLGYWDVFYQSLSLASLVTGMSGLVVMLNYEVPGVVRALHSRDPAEADAAWAAIERLRPELLPQLFSDVGGVRPEERAALAATIDRARVLEMTAARAADRWRTVGPYYLIGVLIALALYLVVLVMFEPDPITAAPGAF
jgi:uncharacterized membrane protein YraQ (UPF0718 family)